MKYAIIVKATHLENTLMALCDRHKTKDYWTSTDWHLVYCIKTKEAQAKVILQRYRRRYKAAQLVPYNEAVNIIKKQHRRMET